MSIYKNVEQDGIVAAGEVVAWIKKEDGSGSPPFYIGNYSVGDIEENFGETTLVRVPDPNNTNEWNVIRKLKGPADPVDWTLTGRLARTLGPLDRLNCPFTIYILFLGCDFPKNNFASWQGGFYLTGSQINGRSTNALDNLEEQGTPGRAYNGQSDKLYDLSVKTYFNKATGSANNIVGVTFAGEERCASPGCGTSYQDAGKEGMAFDSAGVIYYTDDGGDNWTSRGVPDAGWGASVGAITHVYTSPTEIRWIAFNGSATTTSGNLEIAVSDDSGVTWSVSEAGAVAGQFLPKNSALFSFHENNIWLGTNDGYVYTSDDYGVTWTVADAGTITTDVINGVVMWSDKTGYFVGANDISAKTSDGGANWTAGATTPNANTVDLNCVAAFGNAVVVGAANGTVYASYDNLETWIAQTFSGSGSGSVVDIIAVRDQEGLLLHVDGGSAGHLHHTVAEGALWQKQAEPASPGNMYAATAVSASKYWVGGAAGLMTVLHDTDISAVG